MMIRFKTVDPDKPEKSRPEAPQPAPVPDVVDVPAGDDKGAKSGGLARKTPLRAKKRETAPLFDKAATATEE